MDFLCSSFAEYIEERKIKLLSEGPSACGNCMHLVKHFGDEYVNSAKTLDALNKTCERLDQAHKKAVADFEEARALFAAEVAATTQGHVDILSPSSLHAKCSEKDLVVYAAKEASQKALAELDAFRLNREDMLSLYQRLCVRELKCKIRVTAMYEKLVSA